MIDKLPLIDVTPLPGADGDAATDAIAVEPQRYTADQAGPGKRLRLHYTLELAVAGEAAAEPIASTFGQSPASMTVGDGQLPQHFEKLLFGLRAGERQRFELAPEQGFGTRNPDNVQRIARSLFPAGLELQAGVVVGFSDAAGNEQPGVVLDWDSREVRVDFNHPLAGRDLVFTVELLQVEEVEDA